MAALRIILPAAAIALTLALFLQLAWPARTPIPRRTSRRGGIGIAVLTAVYAVAAFTGLGSARDPQHFCTLEAGESATLALDGVHSIGTVWYYTGLYTGEYTLAYSDDGITYTAAGTMPQGYADLFKWLHPQPADAAPASAAYVRITASAHLELGEFALLDAQGERIAVREITGPASAAALCDEADTVPASSTYFNSSYFDEIYHGRTGYEQLHKMPVYETTHPPLGKDLIMVGIALFGMTAFGWRFAGTLFGVLLVPLAWCFVRRLTRKPWAAATAGVLLALDFMRFSQSRLATIDVYGTFFILLGAYCMVWYCQRVLTDGVNRALLPMALGGVAFGLGCAAKWTGIYAGAGLAVLYLGVLYARWQQKRPGFRAEFRTAAVGGVLFYVLLPLCLYIGSYLPYWWRDPAFSLSDWWQCQVSMFSYHATLKATHPFESRWYTWLLGLRPVWYYRNGYLPYGMKASIAGMAGPVIWLVGLAALVGLLWHQVSGRGSRQGAGVLILYGTQLIPWMLVTRCTFLYHYFPSSMFCLAALALVLARMKHADWAKKIAAGLCVVALVLFVLYYPALSGLPIPAWWADALNVLPSFGFY